MSQSPEPFRDPDLEAIAHRLRSRVETELAALGELEARLGPLKRAATVLDDEESLADLARRADALQKRRGELETLRGELSPPPSNPRPAPKPEAKPAVDAPARPAAPAPATPIAPAAGASVERPVRRPARRTPAAPAWNPRDLEVLEAQRDQIMTALDALPPDLTGLAHFKMQAALFQGAWEERKRHPGGQDDWRELSARFRDLQRERWTDHYCIPLAADIHQAPSRWERLAEHYHHLALAEGALLWLDRARADQAAAWVRRDAVPVLEAVGAGVTLLHRWLQRYLPSNHDDQQAELHETLRIWGREEGVYLRSLQSEDLVSDTELEQLAANLKRRLCDLQESARRKQDQTEAVQRFQQAAERAGQGARGDDPEQLCDLIHACLEAGVPPTDRRLRDPLLDLAWMLEDDPRVERVLAAVEEEEQRRLEAQQTASAEEPPPALDALPEDLREMLERVLSVTRGRRGVVIGGQCREDSRQVLEEAFAFADLQWPSRDPSDSFEPSVQDIRRADVVFLTRFNRRKAKEAFRLCREQGKTLICLPKGYGLHQVITRTFEHLTRGDR
jgi:hypothetical protein